MRFHADAWRMRAYPRDCQAPTIGRYLVFCSLSFRFPSIGSVPIGSGGALLTWPRLPELFREPWEPTGTVGTDAHPWPLDRITGCMAGVPPDITSIYNLQLEILSSVHVMKLLYHALLSPTDDCADVLLLPALWTA